MLASEPSAARFELTASRELVEPPPARFDVICAGEAHWDEPTSSNAAALDLRPGGGALNAAVALARRGARVALIAGLADDRAGRALIGRVAACGVDTRGATLEPSRASLVIVEGAGASRRIVSHRVEDELAITVPSTWSASVLLLSGVSPALVRAASFCKAARAARRAGTLVVLDINARPRAWWGRDARAAYAVLREADVVRCAPADLCALAISSADLRAALPDRTVLVEELAVGAVRARGPFGEVVRAAAASAPARQPGAGDVFTAALCLELARTSGHPGDRADAWTRAIERGQRARVMIRSA